MPEQITGVLVLIASPSDTSDERIAVSEALADWNVIRGRRQSAALLGWRFEKHAVPQLGDRAQEIINEQAVTKADAVVAFFDSTLGTSTGVDVSGTAEEINRAADAGKPVHVYFSRENLSRDVNPQQLQVLNDFQEGLKKRGLLGFYESPADLADQVIHALEHDLETHGWSEDAAAAARAKPGGADLRWRHELTKGPKGTDSKGNMKYRTTRSHLIVNNESGVAAESLTFTVEPIDDTQFHFEAIGTTIDLSGHSQMSWPLIPTGGFDHTGNNVRVEAEWREGEQVKSKSWSIALDS